MKAGIPRCRRCRRRRHRLTNLQQSGGPSHSPLLHSAGILQSSKQQQQQRKQKQQHDEQAPRRHGAWPERGATSRGRGAVHRNAGPLVPRLSDAGAGAGTHGAARQRDVQYRLQWGE